MLTTTRRINVKYSLNKLTNNFKVDEHIKPYGLIEYMYMYICVRTVKEYGVGMGKGLLFHTPTMAFCAFITLNFIVSYILFNFGFALLFLKSLPS